MSQLRKEQIDCPQCGEHGEFDLWTSVNVDLDPELREKIFSEELLLWECPKSGAKIYVPFGTLYHDMTHKFMLFFQHEEPKEGKYEPMEVPKAFGLEDGYTIRLVCGVDNLKEKIVILEHGLNDVAVERMKYMQSHIIHPEIAEKGYHLFFGGINRDDKELSEHGSIIFFFRTEDDKTMSNALPMDVYYEHCLACDLDPRMKVESCQCVDEGWMSMQLKSHKV